MPLEKSLERWQKGSLEGQLGREMAKEQNAGKRDGFLLKDIIILHSARDNCGLLFNKKDKKQVQWYLA